MSQDADKDRPFVAISQGADKDRPFVAMCQHTEKIDILKPRVNMLRRYAF